MGLRRVVQREDLKDEASVDAAAVERKRSVGRKTESRSRHDDVVAVRHR